MASEDENAIAPWFDVDRLLDLPPETRHKPDPAPQIVISKALSRLLREIYQAAVTLPLGKFEDHIFLPIQEYLPFDSAWLGLSTITERGPVLHESYTFGLPANFVTDWQFVMPEDPLAPRVIASPGQAVVLRVTDACLTQSFRDFAGKFGLAQFMCAISLDPVLKTCTHLSLYRSKLLPIFSAYDAELIEALVPNLASAIPMNRVRHIEQLRAESSPHGFSVAVCNRRGIIQYAESNFGELILMEWPGWQGSKLPGALTNMTTPGASASYVGKSVAAELEWKASDILLIKIRAKTPADSLTPRELAIARMFGEGKTYKEVAKHLGISPATVRHHLRQAYAKLNVQNKGEIAWLLK